MSALTMLHGRFAPAIWIDQVKFCRLMETILTCKDVPGDLAEFGVYKGGVSAAMAHLCPRRTVHLFDTFEGMPDTAFASDEVHKPGDFADTNAASVMRMANTHGNAVAHVGRFPETTEGLDDLRFAVVHIDADYYESTRDAIRWFWPRLNAGGALVFDDFRWPNCPGVERAIVELQPEYGYLVQQAAPCQARIWKR